MINFPMWSQALFWGLLSGSALLIGSLSGYYLPLSKRVISIIMAFGSGVLLSAVSFELIPEAHHQGGMVFLGIGFFAGGCLYTLADYIISKHGASHRKRSNELQQSEEEYAGSGLTLAIGALIDGIPESIVLGLGLISKSSVSYATLIAIFISNIPEGLSSTVGMKKNNRSKSYIFGLWIGITVISGVSSLMGFVFFKGLPAEVVSMTIALAAGGILTMVADTMIPEAYAEVNTASGLAILCGYLFSYYIGKI